MDGTAQVGVRMTPEFEPGFDEAFRDSREANDLLTKVVTEALSRLVPETSLTVPAHNMRGGMVHFPMFAPLKQVERADFASLFATWASPTLPRSSSNALPASVSVNWGKISGLSLPLYRRLVLLAQKADGWRGQGSKRLKSSSIAAFLSFCRATNTDMVEPFLTLSPAGNLFAEWHSSWKRHLDIEFEGDESAYFGLFSGATTVIEGKTGTRELAQILLQHPKKPLRWTRN